ncbi:DUF3970 family protein [Paenibacillus macerans]|uniref:DUF3970 domain-containing protein n=1 Tax=Paenibacillus macerans TaxID=44252 RepID=A0A090YLH7_PAEMA|nr:hypothetical protein DJ90_2982 [Paenibacillus macerans]GIP08810.1 hypothetical protein J1TS5_09800 [Paenibacillus macerans]
MLKIRVEGLPREIDRFLEHFQDYYRVLQRSKPYPNRNSEYVRVYVEIGSISE